MKIDKALIDKYNVPVPRYTSYPPANHFFEETNSSLVVDKIRASNLHQPKNIAFYVHIPFCSQICYYCGCNAYRAKDKTQVELYVEALKKEIADVTVLLDKDRPISKIHFGGGTPNAISTHFLKDIVETLKQKHRLSEVCEIAIECNPEFLNHSYIDDLLAIGFNRISLGIQDFDDAILNNVNRNPSKLPIADLLNYIRLKNPLVSVNLDFIYGLPGQTSEHFYHNIEQAIALKPERLVTFSYAHVPWLKKHQQILEKQVIPSGDEKMKMFLLSKELLESKGYISIGLDHYVLPQDELAQALETQQLHRNFQGYSTRKTTGQVYAFGVSSISQLEYSYFQNVKNIQDYIRLIQNGESVVEKAYYLSEKEVLIREVITEIMCNGYLDFNQMASKYHCSIQACFDICGFKTSHLNPFLKDDLVEFKNNALRVTQKGFLFVRNIAVLFDPAYTMKSQLYSKSV